MTALRAAALLLLLASCAPSPIQEEADRRDRWRQVASGAFVCRTRPQLEAFLDRIRSLPPRRPRNSGGGSFQLGPQAAVHDDLYPLDEDFDLYTIWNDQARESGFRSVEVVSFSDLRPRIPRSSFEALRILHRSPTANGPASVDPVRLIRAVNAVLALGTEAPSALKAYDDLSRQLPFEEVRKHSIDEYRILPVVQLAGGKPSPFLLGDGGVEIPEASAWPLFPLTVEGDVPFLVVTDYQLAGRPEDVRARLGPELRVQGKPLSPSLNPVEAVERLTASARWALLLSGQSARRGVELKRRVRNQALEALAPIYRPPDEYSPRSCCEDPSEAAWREVVAEVRAMEIRWDPGRQDFVRSR
ncbi:MAG: hypothetical protein JO332_12985 [Planctomycetaceae bacterium]|nr:hypothetical protein [Planctomycetaceae bacterium]